MSPPAEGALSVFGQLWNPAKAYSALLSRSSAIWSAISSSVVILAISTIPVLAAPVRLDAVLSMPGGPSLPVAALPLISLAERLMLAGLGGAAVWAVAKAAGRRTGLVLCLQAALLAQPVYVAASVGSGLVLDAFGAPPGASPGPAALLGTPSAGAPVLAALAWLLLSMFDLPSILCLSCWGLGIASLERRPASSGMATTFSLYVLAILLLALPVLSGPPG